MSPFWQAVLKKLDNAFRIYISPLISRMIPRHQNTRASKRVSENPLILIIRPGGAGDAILLTPSIRMLKEKIPNSKIHFLGERRNIEFAKFCYGDIVEKFFVYDSLHFPLFVIRNISRYDVVVDTEQFFVLPSFLGKILGKITIGFSSVPRFNLLSSPSSNKTSFSEGNLRSSERKVLDFSLSYTHFSYEALEFFRLFGFALKIIGCEFLSYDPKTYEVKTYPKDEEILRYFVVNPNSKITRNDVDIVVAPYTTKREKLYPYFDKIIETLSKRYKLAIVGNRKMNVAEIFSLVSSSKVVVGVDNAILHLGTLARKPCIALFGPTNHLKWSWRKNTTVIRSNLWCSPCSYFAEIPKCPRDAKCMKDIQPSKVISEIEYVISLQG